VQQTRFIGQIVGEPRDWPIPGMTLRLNLVVLVGIMSAAPWIALVWLGHRSPWLQHTPSVPNLQRAWDLITSCALAFAGFVAIALLPTGALRSLWLATASGSISKDQLAEEFSATDVLLYGAVFGSLSLIVVVPLVFAWRAAARRLVDATYPPTAHISEEHDKGRARLESLLNLDIAVVSNPLTVLSVMTPLVTSVVAAFLPEVGD
jgi:hypothetical protein